MLYASPGPASQSPGTMLDAGLISRIKEQVTMLKEYGAKNGAHRLEAVVQHYQHYTLEGAAQYIRKDEIIDELENQPPPLLSAARMARNILSILPIILTWYALFGAVKTYESDLAATPGDLYQPFLLLWQEGFHHTLPWYFPIFSSAAITDFVFLLALAGTMAFIPYLENRNYRRLHQKLEDFDAVITDLLEEIGKSGADAHLADSDVAKLSTIIEQSIQTTLGRLMLNYDRVAEEARLFVEKTSESTGVLVKKFDDDLIVFNSDVRLLTNDLQKVDQNLL